MLSMPPDTLRRSLHALPPGTVLHDYVIDSELGSGGFSIVYLARHRLNSEWLFAVKEFLPRELAARDTDGTSVNVVDAEAKDAFEDGLRRFRDEAEQLRKFRNEPYIVSCVNYFEWNGTAYLVMDYDDGLPLSEFLRQREAAGQPFIESDLRAVVEPLLEGLEVVHRVGVLHRDIKPGNIFVRRQDDITGRPAHPVLIDFGAAKQNYLARHSRSQAPYTPGYAAYEQVSSMGEIGPWTDMYALGALMWRMVAGGSADDSRLLVSDEAGIGKIWSPEPRATEMRSYALHRGRSDPMVPAAVLGFGRYSPHLLEAIDRCLALYPENRVRDCGVLRDLLQSSPGVTLHRSELGSTPPKGRSERKLADQPIPSPGKSTALGSTFPAPASRRRVPRQEQGRQLASSWSNAPFRARWVVSILVISALSVFVFQRFRQLAEPRQTDTAVSAEASNSADIGVQADCASWASDPGSFFRVANAQDVNGCLMDGTDIRLRFESGATALHFAAEFSGIPDVVNALVNAGASVNVRDGDGNTVLHAAARNTGNPEMLTTLVNEGASVNDRDGNGGTALHVAARNNNNPEVILALVNLGADPNSQAHSGTGPQRWAAGITPLHLAAAYNDNPEMIHALVNLGADINVRSDSGGTPLHSAAESTENPEVIDALLNAGAIVNARHVRNGDTALHIAAQWNDNPDVIDTLLNAGADINARDDSGETPLHSAASLTANSEVIEVLVNAGAIVNAPQARNGETPLHRAAGSNGNPDIIDTLLDAGADIDARNDNGETPLHRAALFNDNPEVLVALITAGATVNTRIPTTEQTPLHVAARWNDNPAVIAALLHAGADINSRDFLGETALDEARWNDNPAVREAIENAQAVD